MPRGRKKSLLKNKDSKNNTLKSKKLDISKEVRNIFFNSDIHDDEVETAGPSDNEDTPIGDIDIEEATINLNPLEDEEVVEGIKEKETIVAPTEDIEQFVVTSISDNGEEIFSIQSFRSNKPPKDSWADKATKFSCGQKIMPKSISKKDMASYEVAVVISCGSMLDTYHIKQSRAMNETIIRGIDWVPAAASCKPYKDYWESISPTIKINKRP